MTNPRFSVVIPTRERPATLRFCLQTCLAQDFDDYEVIVCDNFGGPATTEVVREQACPRLRYVRSPGPLAMSANYELALSHARGEYILILGDDDGLLPFSLREIDALARRTDAKAIRWSPAFYSWPNVDLAGQGNYLCLSLSRQFGELDGRQMIRSVLSSLDYNALPMLYANAAVHRDIVEKMRQTTGRVFPCRIPDVYTAFVVAYLARKFVSVTAPLSVSGLSGKSNGVACVMRTEANAINTEFHTLNTASSFPPHPWIPDLTLFPIAAVAESFFRAKASFFPDDRRLDLPRKSLMEKLVGAMHGDEASRRRSFAGIRATAEDDAELLAWFDATFPEMPPSAPAPRVRPERLGFDGDNLHVDTTAFGVTDIAGAADLVVRLLGREPTGIQYDLQGRWAEISELQKHLMSVQRHVEDIYRKDWWRPRVIVHKMMDGCARLGRRLAS